MVIIDELLLKFVEGDGFKKFMSVCCPKLKSLLDGLYELVLGREAEIENFSKRTLSKSQFDN